MHMSHLIPFLLFLFFLSISDEKVERLTNSVFLLRCLTQLALCQTVNHEREPHYHNHRNNPRFVPQEHTIGEEEWVFKESESSFRILLLKPLQGLRGRGTEPHTYKP